MKGFFRQSGTAIHWPFSKAFFVTDKRLSRLVIWWSYEVVGVSSTAAWYFYNALHFTLIAAWTESDVDAGELEHHFL